MIGQSDVAEDDARSLISGGSDELRPIKARHKHVCPRSGLEVAALGASSLQVTNVDHISMF